MASRLPHLNKKSGPTQGVQQQQQQVNQTQGYGNQQTPLTNQQAGYNQQYNQQVGYNQQYNQQTSYQNQGQMYQDPNQNQKNSNQAYFEQQKQLHQQNLNPNYNPNFGQQGYPDSSMDLLKRQSNPHDQSNVMGGSQSPARRGSKSNMDSIPRPIIYQEESVKYKEYVGNSNGVSQQNSAPFSFQYYEVRDEGNAGPRFIRPCVYSFATEPNLLTQMQLPQGCIVMPFSDPTNQEEPVPYVEYFQKEDNDNGKITSVQSLFRCTRCHAYVNPYFKFQEGGNIAICNICQKPNKVPNEYYSPLSGNERSDKASRPELSKGVYDMAAPSNYPKKKITNNYIMLCLEMTPATIQSGIFAQALYSLSIAIQSMPAPERTSVSICTYGSQINFYSIPKDLSNDPQLIVVADLDDPYCPFPRNALFLNVIEDKEKIDYIIEKLQKNSEIIIQEAETQNKIHAVKTASIGSVVQSIATMLDDHPGRIIAFTSQLPTIGFGKLKRRDDVKIMNTEQEKLLYVPQCKSYVELSKNLLKNSITVDLFVFCPDFFDLATISLLCTETGGQLYYYPHYTTSDAEKVHYELFRNLTRSYYMDCIMTVRTSAGIILEDYYTNKGKVSVRDLQMSSLNPDSVIGVQYKQEEKITTPESYIQYACLHTNMYGQTLIRVINLALPVNNNIQNMFKLGDLDASFSMIVRRTLSNISTQTIKQLSDSLVQQIVNIFYSYRYNVAASSSPSQLILPESTKFLIIYILAVLKSEIFKNAQAKPDFRIYEIIRLFSFPPNQLSNFLYPKIYPLHSILENQESEQVPGTLVSDERTVMPTNIPCSIDRLSSFGIYLIDNGETIYIYVMKDANPDIFEQLYGTPDYEQLREIQQYPSLNDNDFSNYVNAIIDQVRRNRNGAYHNIRTVLYKDPFEPNLKNFFVEDEIRGIMTYNNFLCEIHKRIQSKQTS